MSIDRNLYVGVYVTTPKFPKEDVTYDVWGCVKCQNPHTFSKMSEEIAVYCVTCGSKCCKYKWTTKESRDLYEIMDDMDGAFRLAQDSYNGESISMKCDVWVPNSPRNFFDDSFMVEVTAGLIQQQIKNFEIEYAKELDHLKKTCGSGSVCYGALQWFT